MEVFETIGKRHSYRGDFTSQPIPREDLKKIVQAGIQAPSGCNAQTTSFVIVDDPALIRQIGDIVDKPVARKAQAIILCIVEHRPVYQKWSFGVEDCAAAVENILLAITALGYATVWIDGALIVEVRAWKIAKIAKVPDNREVRVLLPVGVPTEIVQQRERHDFSTRAWFNEFGTDRQPGDGVLCLENSNTAIC